MKNKISLQINLAPGDYPHVRHILKHQLDVFNGQVDEIILTLDTKASKGRFAEGWEANKQLLNEFLQKEIQSNYPVKIIPVDYSQELKQKIAEYFFGASHLPDKDFRGGPFYAYFYGLFTATNALVFHLDSDIFLGGRSPNWISEALEFFAADPSCFIISPLPGPPRADDQLKGQDIVKKIAPYTWQLDGMSTRLFIMDKSKFKAHKLQLTKPSVRNQVKAIVDGNANANLPELIISAFIKKHHLKRIDFLGADSGLWSLHPPYRTKVFYDDLPLLIDRIERNDLPKKQRGFYDIIDEVCDWTPAREKLAQNRWWKKFVK